MHLSAKVTGKCSNLYRVGTLFINVHSYSVACARLYICHRVGLSVALRVLGRDSASSERPVSCKKRCQSNLGEKLLLRFRKFACELILYSVYDYPPSCSISSG